MAYFSTGTARGHCKSAFALPQRLRRKNLNILLDKSGWSRDSQELLTKQSLRERQLPFLPSLNTPNAETRAALDEADRMLKDTHLKTYSVDDLLTELKK